MLRSEPSYGSSATGVSGVGFEEKHHFLLRQFPQVRLLLCFLVMSPGKTGSEWRGDWSFSVSSESNQMSLSKFQGPTPSQPMSHAHKTDLARLGTQHVLLFCNPPSDIQRYWPGGCKKEIPLGLLWRLHGFLDHDLS